MDFSEPKPYFARPTLLAHEQPPMARLAIEAKNGSLSGVEERLAAGDSVNQADGVRESQWVYERRQGCTVSLFIICTVCVLVSV